MPLRLPPLGQFKSNIQDHGPQNFAELNGLTIAVAQVGSLVAAAHNVLSFVSPTNDTRNEGMGIPREGQTLDCWGARAVFWLRQKFANWPVKAVARELDEPESVVKSWWNGSAHPDRKKLQKLSGRYRADGFGSFVMGAPVEGELEERMDLLVAEIIEIRAYLRSAPPRVAVGDDGQRPDLDGVQAPRKAVK